MPLPNNFLLCNEDTVIRKEIFNTTHKVKEQ